LIQERPLTIYLFSASGEVGLRLPALGTSARLDHGKDSNGTATVDADTIFLRLMSIMIFIEL
jgi:hypothetical protein